MRVEIWSDVVCPWCYIGKRRFEAALAKFEHREEVEVVWRSFELDRHAPTSYEGDYVSRLARKYGVALEEAQGMIDHMTAAAGESGLAFRFDNAKPGNTFDAHRLLHLACTRGLQDEMKERLLAATFVEGAPIGDPAVLVTLAAQAGLDPEEAAAVLGSDAFAEEVRADEAQAAGYGIGSVPFFVLDATFGLAGAHPTTVLLAMLERAWNDLDRDEPVPAGTSAPSCGDDACDV